MGFPAVVGTVNATKRIKTGDRVRVDGSKGEITLFGWVKMLGASDRPPTSHSQDPRYSCRCRTRAAQFHDDCGCLAGDRR